MDERANLPPDGVTTWQFNFKFNLTEDMYAEDSIDLLQNSGIQFDKHERDGIDPVAFAEMMLTSGLVLMEEVKWLSFHSGYDFGYLIHLLTNQVCSPIEIVCFQIKDGPHFNLLQNLPKTEEAFFENLKLYFPNVYDVKYLMKSCKNLKGGLQELANELEVQRIGPQHQAGSDSLLTGQTFFKMKEMFFEDDIDDSKYLGHVYGLGTNFVAACAPPTTTASSASLNAASSTTAATADRAAASSAASSVESDEDGDGSGKNGNNGTAADSESEASEKN